MNLEENPAIQPAQNTGIQLDIPLPGIVVGVYSDALSDSLQAKSDLSLKKAIELSRQAQARQHNLEYVRENTAATNKTVDYVKPAHAINKHKAQSKKLSNS